MPRFESVLAALTVVVCTVLLVRLVLPPRRRARLDGAAAAAWWSLRSLPRRVRGASRRDRSLESDAAREARAAIERARRAGVQREGNVIRPKSFRGPRRPH